MKNKNKKMVLVNNYKLSFFGIFLVLFLLLGATLFIDPPAQAYQAGIKLETKQFTAAISLPQQTQTWAYISEINHAQINFNALGFKSRLNSGDASQVSVYLKTAETDWQKIELIQQDDSLSSEFPLAINGTDYQYQIVLTRAERNAPSPELSQIEIFCLNTAENATLSRSLRNTLNSASTNNANNYPVITRAEWGADESWRFWEPEYATPTTIVLHHTAGGTGADDPTATLRAIYYWHAQVLGWGDIGYNYIMDTAGNIYEGRYGGPEVIGAHVYNDITETNYNVGSIGVAILGCYENEQEGCSEANTFDQALQDKLTDFLAYLTNLHQIPPTGENLFIDQKTFNIIGHRSVDYTLCPGNEIYNGLEDIRSETQVKYSALQKKYFSVKFKTHDLNKSLTPKETQTVTVTYKNNGTRVLKADNVFLKIYNATGKRATALRDASWTDLFGKFKMQETQVLPNEYATFSFQITAPELAKKYHLKLKFFINKAAQKAAEKTLTTEVHATETINNL